jgi:hypothetical protein
MKYCKEFMEYAMKNGGGDIINLLLNCPERVARESITKILATSGNSMFVIE